MYARLYAAVLFLKRSFLNGGFASSDETQVVKLVAVLYMLCTFTCSSLAFCISHSG